MKSRSISTIFAFGLVLFGGSVSSAQAANIYFGEDQKSFENPTLKNRRGNTVIDRFGNKVKNPNRTTTPPSLLEMPNGFAAEQDFLNEIQKLGYGSATLNFEPEEGFIRGQGANGAFSYELNLQTTNNTPFSMTIFDSNENPDFKTTIENSHQDKNETDAMNVSGGRYGISDSEDVDTRLKNQFLNTNAGIDSNVVFTFSQATSAFGFYGLDFERGGIMGLEVTKTNGQTQYYSLGLSNPKDYAQGLRGTSFFYGLIAESQDEYFTEVRFRIKDGIKDNNDIVSFDRMTFASPVLKGNNTQDVPEPSVTLLSSAIVVLGSLLYRKKQVA
jgi:hypothetical protein